MIFWDIQTRLRTVYAQYDAIIIFPDDRGETWVEVAQEDVTIIVAPLTIVHRQPVGLDSSFETVHAACLSHNLHQVAIIVPDWLDADELIESVFGDGTVDITLFAEW